MKRNRIVLRKRSHSSNSWLSEHFKDKYVKESHRNKLLSRAWFKLHDIDKKNKIFRLGMTVLDLGSSPGSWSKYALKKIGNSGKIFACDMLPMNFLPNVNFIQGDLKQKNIMNKLLFFLKNITINLVMSDMSPNTSGCSLIDVPKILLLGELAFSIAQKVLLDDGVFLIKTFQGVGFNHFLKKIRTSFLELKICKPDSSRGRSREVFLLATKFRR